MHRIFGFLVAAFATLIAAVTLTPPSAAQAVNYPQRPIKLLVGASPGGTTDTLARAIAVEVSSSLGQPVLVVNRPGAGIPSTPRSIRICRLIPLRTSRRSP